MVNGLTAVLWILFAVTASAQQEWGSLQEETQALEAAIHSGHATVNRLERLADLYFLTSRCPDVVRLLAQKHGSWTTLCACGGKCAKHDSGAALERFKLALSHSKPDRRRGPISAATPLVKWTNPKVQEAWKLSAQSPEACYWALKTLAGRQDRLALLAKTELQRALESLDVPF